jgi:hypothetical protein
MRSIKGTVTSLRARNASVAVVATVVVRYVQFSLRKLRDVLTSTSLTVALGSTMSACSFIVTSHV